MNTLISFLCCCWLASSDAVVQAKKERPLFRASLQATADQRPKPRFVNKRSSDSPPDLSAFGIHEEDNDELSRIPDEYGIDGEEDDSERDWNDDGADTDDDDDDEEEEEEEDEDDEEENEDEGDAETHRILPSCTLKTIDFSAYPDGQPLSGGEYVRKEWVKMYGMSIKAAGVDGGYTPRGKARLFDTSHPARSGLGSPNNRCPIPGPGSGAGGQPNNPGENCKPQGNVLIIQDDQNITVPMDLPGGGFLNFYFLEPTFVRSVGLMDINTGRAYLKIYRFNSTRRTYRLSRFGHNSFQNLLIERARVTKMHVFFLGRGGVTHVEFCPPPLPPPPMASTPMDPCISETSVYNEDFESFQVDGQNAPGGTMQDPTGGWVNGRLDYDSSFSKFLGRFVNGDRFPWREFDIPDHTDSVVVEFDFYEIDSWNGYDNLGIMVNGEHIPIGTFHSGIDEQIMANETSSGIMWESRSEEGPRHIGFRNDAISRYNDQKHRIKVEIPRSAFEHFGKVYVRLETMVSGRHLEDESGGFDNFKVTAYRDCVSGAPSTSVAPSSFNSSSTHPNSQASSSTSDTPSISPSLMFSVEPTQSPSRLASSAPSMAASSSGPSTMPTSIPSQTPSTAVPSSAPSTTMPSLAPSSTPTWVPSAIPSIGPSAVPSSTPSTNMPSFIPSTEPTLMPSVRPSTVPSSNPSTNMPSSTPSTESTLMPSVIPSITLSTVPSSTPSTTKPSLVPSTTPSLIPSISPSTTPSDIPSAIQSTVMPMMMSEESSSQPSMSPPSTLPTANQMPHLSSALPSTTPSSIPSRPPSKTPSQMPSQSPSKSNSPSYLQSQSPSLTQPPSSSTLPSLLPSLSPDAFITRDAATERITIPFPSSPDTTVNVQNDCPHDDDGLADWHDPTTWIGQRQPVAGQNVTLPANSRVVIRKTVQEQLGFIFVDATSELIIADSTDHDTIHLNINGMQVNGKLTIGSESCRIQHTQIVITLHGTRPSDVEQNPPKALFKGIDVSGGIISVHGKRYYMTWTRLSKTVELGDTRLLLQDRVNWEPGQEIVLITTAMKDSREFHQNEVFTIDSVVYQPDAHEVETVVLLNKPVGYRHLGTKEYQAEVGLLSRTIVIEGSATDSEPTDPDPLDCVSATNDWYGDKSIPCPNAELTGYGGHVIIHMGGKGYVSGVELRRMGQTNVLGRYPMHFHVLGTDCDGCYFTDSSIYRSYYRCISIHGTNNLLVSENVAYDIVGFCYYLEDGVEEGNTLSFNLAAHIHMIAAGPNEDPPTSGGNTLKHIKQHDQLTVPADVSASGFYITNVHNNIIGNSASGGWAGFAFPTLPQPIGFHRDEQKRPMNVLSLTIDGNTAHSTGWWWHRSGTLYFGGALFFDSEDPDLLVYNPGRDHTYKRNTCIVDKCVTANNCNKSCPEHEKAWIEITNTKTFLTPGAGIQSWNGRLDINRFETHDMGLSMEGLQDGISIDDMLAVCRSGNELVLPPAASSSKLRGLGFFWYDTNQEHIITNSTFRQCGARAAAYNQYNNDPTRGCGPDECRTDSFVFGFRAHSNQHNPELMQATKNITFENCGRRFSLHDSKPASFPSSVSGRLQNWVDYDGSVTGMGTKSLLVSGYESCGLWWNADPEAVYDPQGPLYFLDQIGRRGLGHLKLHFDDNIQDLAPASYCDNSRKKPCPALGYLKHRGQKFVEDQGLPVPALADIVGLTGGFGWELRLNEGAPKKLRIERVEVLPDTPMLLSVAYPLGTTINVTAYAHKCTPSSEFSCEEHFHPVATLADVYSSLGNVYHYDDTTGFVTVRIIATPIKYVGNPEWIMPGLDTLDRSGKTYAIPRFQRFDLVLPKVNSGPRLEIVSDCEPSPTNPSYCATLPPQEVEPVEVCPAGFEQIGFDRCCSVVDENDCLFAYEAPS